MSGKRVLVLLLTIAAALTAVSVTAFVTTRKNDKSQVQGKNTYDEKLVFSAQIGEIDGKAYSIGYSKYKMDRDDKIVESGVKDCAVIPLSTENYPIVIDFCCYKDRIYYTAAKRNKYSGDYNYAIFRCKKDGTDRSSVYYYTSSDPSRFCIYKNKLYYAGNEYADDYIDLDTLQEDTEMVHYDNNGRKMAPYSEELGTVFGWGISYKGCIYYIENNNVYKYDMKEKTLIAECGSEAELTNLFIEGAAADYLYLSYVDNGRHILCRISTDGSDAEELESRAYNASYFGYFGW